MHSHEVRQFAVSFHITRTDLSLEVLAMYLLWLIFLTALVIHWAFHLLSWPIGETSMPIEKDSQNSKPEKSDTQYTSIDRGKYRCVTIP